MVTRKITFYKPAEKMPENKTLVLIVTLGGRMESAVYRNGRFYEPEEQFYYTPVEDVELWASADWEITRGGRHG